MIQIDDVSTRLLLKFKTEVYCGGVIDNFFDEFHALQGFYPRLNLTRLGSLRLETFDEAFRLFYFLLLIFKRTLLDFLAEFFLLQVKGVVTLVGDKLLLRNINGLGNDIVQENP